MDDSHNSLHYVCARFLSIIFFQHPCKNLKQVTQRNSHCTQTSDAPIATPFHCTLRLFYLLLIWCRRTDLAVQSPLYVINNPLFTRNRLVPMSNPAKRLFSREGRQSRQSVVIIKQDSHTKSFGYRFDVVGKGMKVRKDDPFSPPSLLFCGAPARTVPEYLSHTYKNMDCKKL